MSTPNMFGLSTTIACFLSISCSLAHESRLRSSPPRDCFSIDLSSYLNNKASSGTLGVDGFDGSGNTFAVEFLPRGQWYHDGVEFNLPDWGREYDNVKSAGQYVAFDTPVLASNLHVLGVGDGFLGFLRKNPPQEFLLHYSDGSEEILAFESKHWWALHGTQHGDIMGPYRYMDSGEKDYNLTQIFHTDLEIPIQAAARGSTLKAITLPTSRHYNTLHVFAMSVTTSRSVIPGDPSPDLKERLKIRNVRSTRRLHSGSSGHIVEATIANPWPLSAAENRAYWFTGPASISLDYPHNLSTLIPAQVYRLMPGEAVTVEIVVRGIASSRDARVTVLTESCSWTQEIALEGVLNPSQRWEPTLESTSQHSAPSWYRDAKFGIFIHWGPYAVPAWNKPPQYAEWYWYWLQTEGRDGPTYQHHLDAYGSKFVYDDFLDHFTGDDFNASAWTQLFSAAGAKYFVLTAKHHDGFALFDTKNSSDRNSLLLGPRRDFLKELFTAAEKEQPHLHRGTYFSMPEWFAPSYQPIGRELFPGGQAHNPYNKTIEPYTGDVEELDFVREIQYRQMQILVQDYETEIMWCDIGLANKTYELAAEWYNEIETPERQVVMNDRCGIPADFDTPEMVHYATVNKAYWESNMGMDPYSFGYTTTTALDEYRSGQNIIHTLIDIVSKGGNFLLNIGPTGTGKIIDAMANPLLEAGQWLRIYGEAVYGTHTVPLLPEYIAPGVNLRLTRLDDKIYVHSLFRPPPTLSIDAPLAVLAKDHICLMTVSEGCDPVEWNAHGGRLTIKTDDSLLERADVRGIAWVFRITQISEGKGTEAGSGLHDEL